jgi:hypothetical protein
MLNGLRHDRPIVCRRRPHVDTPISINQLTTEDPAGRSICGPQGVRPRAYGLPRRDRGQDGRLTNAVARRSERLIRFRDVDFDDLARRRGRIASGYQSSEIVARPVIHVSLPKHSY